MKLTIASAQRDYGRVSMGNTKMPGTTFAVTVDQCNVGRKLAQIKGSTCHKCYAATLEKLRPSVHQGWTSNYLKATRMIEEQPEQWARAMAFQIEKLTEKLGEPYHRWFDGGDLASLAMARAIVQVCRLTPRAADARSRSSCKTGLCLRTWSSTMIDDKPIRTRRRFTRPARRPVPRLLESRSPKYLLSPTLRPLGLLFLPPRAS
jgi:hypothetical protein